MSPSYQILSHFRHCWPNKKPCSQGATTTYLRRSEAGSARSKACASASQEPRTRSPGSTNTAATEPSSSSESRQAGSRDSISRAVPTPGARRNPRERTASIRPERVQRIRVHRQGQPAGSVRPDLGPGQRLAPGEQTRLVGLDGEHVVPAPGGDVGRGGGLGVHRVGGDNRPDQVKRFEQGPQCRDLVALGRDLHLPENDPDRVVKGCDQVSGAKAAGQD